MRISHQRYLLILSIVFAAWWVILTIDPSYRKDWLLENVLTLLAVLYIGGTCRRIPMSRVSYTLIFIFLCLHTVGSHYTYAETPYDEWCRNLLGFSINELFGFERNHYDRLIHLAYGVLLAYPVRELFIRIAEIRGFWGYFFPVVLTMSTSMLYELIEWAAALLFGGDLGIAYLGTQGDVWDAHKDMALASLGALLAMFVTAMINARLQRDFAREWNESLRIKIDHPLGEDEIIKMLNDKR